MGIKGLKQLIKKNCPDAIKKIQIESLANCKIAIDSSILLYKYRYLNKNDNFHIEGFVNSVIFFLEKNIIPVFVFDGKPPEAKKLILEQRNETKNKMSEELSKLKELGELEFIDSDSDSESTKSKSVSSKINKIQKNLLVITRQHSIEVMDMLKIIGIPFLQAKSEAEETCAFLEKNGYVDYVLTQDTDVLTFGCENVIFNDNHGVYSLCKLSNVLSGLGDLTYLQFIDLCILCGCDYSCKIPKIGPVNALKIVKEYKNNLLSFLKNKAPSEFNYSEAVELFTRNKDYQYPNELLDFSIKKRNKLEISEIYGKIKINKYILFKLINLI